MLSPWIVATMVATTPAELRELIDLTLEVSPEQAAIVSETKSFEHGADAAGAWQHPRLAIAYQNVPVDSWALGEEPMSMLMLRAEQTVVLPGKTPRRQAAMRERARARTWAGREHANQLRARVTRAYWNLALARQLRALTEQHIELVAQLEEVVRSKYEVGKASQHDFIRVEIWRGRLGDELGDFARRESEILAELNALAHRPLDATVATPDELEPPPAPAILARLVERARTERPALKQTDANAAALRAAAELARYEALPDPMVFAAYGVRKELPTGMGGRDLVTIGVSVPLPVFYGDRNDAAAEQRAAQSRAVDHRREQLADEIAAGLARAHATWSRANDKAATYRDTLVPAARRAVDAALSAYRVDRTDFVSLFETQVELLRFEKTIRNATVMALNARATVAALVGEEDQ